MRNFAVPLDSWRKSLIDLCHQSPVLSWRIGPIDDDLDVRSVGRNNHPSSLLASYEDLQHPVTYSHMTEDETPFVIRIDLNSAAASVVVVLGTRMQSNNPRPLYWCSGLADDANSG